MPLARECQSALGGVVVVVAEELNLTAQIEHRLNFDVRGRLRHDDDGGNGAAARRERHALRVIAGRCADDARAVRPRSTDARSCCTRHAA